MQKELMQLVAGMTAGFREVLDGELAALRAEHAEAIRGLCMEIEALKLAVPVQPEKGARGDKGPSGDPGNDGADGQAGQKGDPGPQGDLGPQGEPGLAGQSGSQGDPGSDGQKGDPGPQGDPGLAGKDGPQGDAGSKGENGADGVSVDLQDVLPHAKAWFSDWALGFERNAAEVLERAAARIPTPKDGADGLGFDDMSVTQTSERAIALEFRRGEQVKTFPVALPGFLDKGVYREGDAYLRGDAVTRGGSLWLAQRDVLAGEVPGREGDGWRLAVKKGGDGPRGERGLPGGDGRAGHDGRNYDGSKA